MSLIKSVSIEFFFKKQDVIKKVIVYKNNLCITLPPYISHVCYSAIMKIQSFWYPGCAVTVHPGYQISVKNS